MNQPLRTVESAGRGATGAWAAIEASTPIRDRLRDYAELCKFRISAMVLFVVGAGFILGSGETVHLTPLVYAVAGTALVAMGSSALNQVIERDADRRMRRTHDRPVAAGRIGVFEATAFGIATAIAGAAALTVLSGAMATGLALATFGLYLAVYTPLKRITAWNTVAGAVPGALPPLIGYAAAADRMDARAAVLFAILFVWQLPHFFAIAWMYREDYRRGGYRMISVGPRAELHTRRWTVLTTFLLVGVSFLPAVVGPAGTAYLTGAVLSGALLIIVAGRMAARLSDATARHMLLASVVYLPVLFIMLLLDHFGG